MVWPVSDERVRKFMVSLYKKRSHVRRSIAATNAMVLQSRTDDEDFENERRLLAKLKYRKAQKRKRVYSIIIAYQV